MNPRFWFLFWQYHGWPALKRKWRLAWFWLSTRLRKPDNIVEIQFSGWPFEPGDVVINGGGQRLLCLPDGRFQVLPQPSTWKQRIRRIFYDELGGWLGLVALLVFILAIIRPLICLIWQ